MRPLLGGLVPWQPAVNTSMPRGVPGPVVLGGDRLRLKKRLRKPTSGSFTKERPGPGRPRGVPNKFTGELKEAILAGVNGSNKQGIARQAYPRLHDRDARRED
jgi:hypothetical protein